MLIYIDASSIILRFSDSEIRNNVINWMNHCKPVVYIELVLH
jgi:hypothetical protein